MQSGPSILKVHEAGKATLVGFTNGGVLEESYIPKCHTDLVKLISSHDCETITFDLTDVEEISRGVLKIMLSLDQSGVKVRVFNPTSEVRELLKVTNLDAVVREVDSPYV